jgi:hypothetical protein
MPATKTKKVSRKKAAPEKKAPVRAVSSCARARPADVAEPEEAKDREVIPCRNECGAGLDPPTTALDRLGKLVRANPCVCQPDQRSMYARADDSSPGGVGSQRWSYRDPNDRVNTPQPRSGAKSTPTGLRPTTFHRLIASPPTA